MAPSPLESQRADVQGLTFELQARKLRRDLRRLDEEDQEIERKRAATASEETARARAASDDARLRREELERQREADEERQQWLDAWIQYGLQYLPADVPPEFKRQIPRAIELALETSSPERPRAIVEEMVTSAIESVVEPWKRQQQIEVVIKAAKQELPSELRNLSDFFPPTASETRAMQAARRAIAQQPPDATLLELGEVARSAGKLVADEYRQEQDREQERVRQERVRKDTAATKRFLISIGVQAVSGHLWRLLGEKQIDFKDISRARELEAAIRSALDEKVAGSETPADVEQMARDLVEEELLLS